jgi:hypothetical protein
MNKQERSQSIRALLLVLVVVAIVIIISAHNRFDDNEPLPVQSTSIPTQIEGSTLTPNRAATQKAYLYATWLAVTLTPFDTQVPFPTGTREGEMVKFSAEKMFLEALNGWDGYLNGISVVIYAGSETEEEEQGAIVILLRLPNRFFSEKVLTPTKHGGVRVVAEQNNRLTLLAADGEIFYFDVPARRFVASLTEIVPTATPPPTYTPYKPVQISSMPTNNPYPLPTLLSIKSP